MARVFHRVEVIEVAEELVEAVDGRQKLVLVAKMVLAELTGGVAHRLQRRGNGHRLGGQAGGCAGLSDRGHAGADRQLAGDEVGATRRAARLGVVVGEQHALGGELVEVRRPAGHHAAVVGADVPDADVVAHDDDDVRLLLSGRTRRACDERQRSDECEEDYREGSCSWMHLFLPSYMCQHETVTDPVSANISSGFAAPSFPFRR